MSFRQTAIYKNKLHRIGKALRQFSEISVADNNFNSLAREIDVLEELSLSSYSLMKALKIETRLKAICQGSSLIAGPSEPEKKQCRLILPSKDLFDDDGN